MSPTIESTGWTVADLMDRFGAIPLQRVCVDPAPGTATEADAIRFQDHEDRLFELIDGTLLEKAMGTLESFIAGVLVRLIGNFVAEHDMGIVLPPDGMMRIAPNLVRIPDVSFVSWSRLPNRKIPDQAIAELVPDVAVEVISRSNTREEMERKLSDYFDAGVRLVWYVYPRSREIHVYSAADQVRVLSKHESLDGGDVLPGFTLQVNDAFGQVD